MKNIKISKFTQLHIVSLQTFTLNLSLSNILLLKFYITFCDKYYFILQWVTVISVYNV